MTSRQLTLNLGHRPALGRQDFMVSPSNAQAVDWLHMAGQHLLRVGLVAATVTGGAVLYLLAVSLLGLKLRQFLRR